MNRLVTASSILLLLLAAACGGDDAPDDVPDEARAVVVAGDFAATGILSTVGAPGMNVTAGAVEGVASSDPKIRRIGDELFIVNRFGGDNITVLDATTLELVDQYATGAGSNPQDVTQVGDKLYVPCLDIGDLVVIDRANDGAISTIDLSAIDDDGVADCTSVYNVGNRVFVACGLLDAFFPVENGVLVVIDSSNDLFNTMPLPDQNPVSWFEADGEEIVIALQPSFSSTDAGCLARITTNATISITCDTTAEDLGGFVSRAVPVGDKLLATITIYDENFASSSKLVWLDGDEVGESMTPASMNPQDLAVCGDHVFVADTTGAGIRVFAMDGDALTELTSDALDIGLPVSGGGGIACVELAAL